MQTPERAILRIAGFPIPQPLPKVRLQCPGVKPIRCNFTRLFRRICAAGIVSPIQCRAAMVRPRPFAPIIPLMPHTAVSPTLSAARNLLAQPIKFDDFIAKLAMKDRVNAERRVEALEAEADPSRAPTWKRLVCALMTLAPHAAKFVGKQTVQFYVADGKYRMQVFALEDLQDGMTTIYCPDHLAEARKAGILSDSLGPASHTHVIEATQEPLRVEPLDKNSNNSAAHYKDMVGWNRKALRITLPPGASKTQIEAAELLCAIAAQHFPKAPPPSDTPGPQRR